MLIRAVDESGEELQLCSKQKKDHVCVIKTLNTELFMGGGKSDVTFYCKGSNGGGCKTKRPSKVKLQALLRYEDGSKLSYLSPQFLVRGNRRGVGFHKTTTSSRIKEEDINFSSPATLLQNSTPSGVVSANTNLIVSPPVPPGVLTREGSGLSYLSSPSTQSFQIPKISPPFVYTGTSIVSSPFSGRPLGPSSSSDPIIHPDTNLVTGAVKGELVPPENMQNPPEGNILLSSTVLPPLPTGIPHIGSPTTTVGGFPLSYHSYVPNSPMISQETEKKIKYPKRIHLL
jgi:hypothetical protein